MNSILLRLARNLLVLWINERIKRKMEINRQHLMDAWMHTRARVLQFFHNIVCVRAHEKRRTWLMALSSPFARPSITSRGNYVQQCLSKRTSLAHYINSLPQPEYTANGRKWKSRTRQKISFRHLHLSNWLFFPTKQMKTRPSCRCLFNRRTHTAHNRGK